MKRFTVVAFAALCVACGPGQIFGPSSPIPTDLQNEEICVANQLISGDINPVTIGLACMVPEDATLQDLIAYLAKALFAKGKITQTARDNALAGVAAARESSK